MGNLTNTICIKCGSEGAYFNGRCLECPECGHEWGCLEEDHDE